MIFNYDVTANSKITFPYICFLINLLSEYRQMEKERMHLKRLIFSYWRDCDLRIKFCVLFPFMSSVLTFSCADICVHYATFNHKADLEAFGQFELLPATDAAAPRFAIILRLYIKLLFSALYCPKFRIVKSKSIVHYFFCPVFWPLCLTKIIYQKVMCSRLHKVQVNYLWGKQDCRTTLSEVWELAWRT